MHLVDSASCVQNNIMCLLLMTSALVWILTRIVHWYIIYIHKPDWWGVPLIFICIEMFNSQYLLDMKCLMYGLLFPHLSTSLRCFWPRAVILKNGLGQLPRTSFIHHLHSTFRIPSRSVAGLTTDSPCGVWGRGSTTCLLCCGPISCLCFWSIVNG